MINLFKQNDGFTNSTFTGLVNNGIEQIPDEIKNDLIKVDEQTYQNLLDHKLMWENGSLVSNPNYAEYEAEKQKEIYKQELAEVKYWFVENDWKPNKIITGEWLENDPRWLEYKQERAAKRARQDELLELIGN